MWVLIDGNNWFAQCDFASSAESGNNLRRRLTTLIAQLEPERVVVCWDSGESFRCKLSSNYKAHREAKPDGFGERLRRTREEIDHLDGVLSIGVPTFEADDLIATFTQLAHDEGEQVIVFSADKDLHQLLVPGSVTQVVKLTRRSPAVLSFDTVSAARLQEKYGVRPSQWVDYRVIVGDTSDGISGVPSLGPKAAAALLQWRPSLDDFYTDPWKAPLSPAQRAKLMRHRELVPEKRRLLTLVKSVPLPANLLSLSGIGS